ncbi:MAG TPA: alpha/beta hydrolase [Polyangia bacterium]|nr:alpha/beta hydrolase [Polyangia bacterium]
MVTPPPSRSDTRLVVRGQGLAARWLTPERSTRDEVIVFLHDALGSIEQWKDFPDRLCAVTGMRGLVFDRLGHGRSPPLSGPRTLDYLREQGEDWLPALLAAAAIEKPVLFGHSDGGSIALFYAAAHAPAALIAEAAHVFVEPLTLQGLRAFGERWATTDIRQRLERHHGDKTLALYSAWHDTWLSPPFAAFDMTARLPHITCPSLIIQGSDDPYGTVAQVEAIVGGVGARARAWLLPDTGHVPHLEQKELVARTVADFLADSLGGTIPACPT